MKLGAFSVYDSKAKAFIQPFYAPNAAVASRMISDAVEQRDHMFHKHAADYTLYQIGEFDETTGLLSSQLKDNGDFAYTNLGCLITFLPADLKELPNV